MTNQPETAVTVDALARMLSAADVEINHGDYPTWDTLAESGQKQYRQAARYLLKRLHITVPAAVSAAVAPPTRAAVLREAADRIEKAADEHPDYYTPQGLYDAADRLRRMADETATETPKEQ
ncbi:hypothetical protein [Streptomyces pseudogriseolus]|uniref:hypothetical protein n=1 Tax=Streptomyces pseudogriseolus TaxID=36817 RepID=UPI0036863BEF